MSRRLGSMAVKPETRVFRAAVETLEARRLLAGGGFTNAGITGEYFNNTTLTGPATFTRKDVRIDFDWGTTIKPGGSIAPEYSAIGTDNYSVRWTGQIIPRFSETYTFKTSSDDGVRLYIRPAGGTWTTLIDNWTAHAWTDNTADYSLTAGTLYDTKLEYMELTGSSVMKLKWSSPGTPEEVIDPLTQSGTNNPDFTAGFTDIVKGARNSWSGVDGNPAPSLDANGWPMGNAEYYFQESLLQGLGVDPMMRGKVSFSFSGKATVGIYGNVDVASLVYTHDPGTNLTTGSFIVRDNGINASTISFRATDRDGNGVVDNQGIANLKMMRPTAPDATSSYAGDTLFAPQLKDAMNHFTMIRYQLVANQEMDWTDRTLPTYFDQQWAGGKVTNPHYGVGGPTANGTSWEHKIMLANETGRDVMFSIPTVATNAYIQNLARLIRYGADANAVPYTQPTANPAYPPLNPNLRVYLELGNELWNYADPFSTDFFNLNKITAADAEANNADFQAINVDNLPLTKDGSGVYNSIWTWRYRKAIQRMVSASDTFRSVFEDSAMPLTSTNPRIRPLYEWMYENINDTARTALSWAERWYSNGDGATPSHVTTPHPLNYWLWGGGGASYYGAVNPNGLTALPSNNSFDATTVANGYNQNPGATEFTFTGTAGIARDNGGGDDIPTPLNGSQVGYITDGGQISFNFTVPSSQTSNVYAFAFKAVNRIRTGGGTDTQNLRVYLDDTIDITAKTSNHPNGYTPAGYDANHPWKAENVRWVYSDYFYTKSANLAAGSTHKITIKGMSSGNQIAFIDDVRITSVDRIFADGIPGGGEAGGQPVGSALQNVLNTEANWARAFGLQEVSYEGGWSLGGDGGSSYVQTNAKYSDSRAVTAQQTLMDYFHQAGSAVNVFGTYGQWPDWFSYYAQQGLLNVGSYPIMQGIDNRGNTLPAEATNGVAVPATLTPANSNLTHNVTSGQINANGWINWTVVIPSTGSYNLALVTTGSGGAPVLLADNWQIASGASGGTLNGSATLTKGSHSIRVRASSATSFIVSQITVSAAATAPAAPSGLSATPVTSSQINLAWTDNAGNETGFKIDQATDSAFTQGLTTITIATPNTTSYSATGLSPGSTYYFRVYAYNGTGNSAYSSAVSAIAQFRINIAHGTLVQNNGVVGNNEGSPAVGSFTGFNANGGYSFLLPTIPAGQQIVSIVFYSGNTSSYYNQSTLAQLPGDVYGLRISPSSNLTTGDYGSGTSQPGTKLSNNWFTGTVGAMPGVDITGWVNSTGYVGGSFVQLRTGTSASEATITSLAARWWTASADATLVITTVPVINIAHGSLVQNNGIVGNNEGSPAVGAFPGFNANGGYSFLLPTIPSGQQITSILFYSGNTSSYYSQGTLAQLPGDVYGLRVSNSSNLSTSDYGSGTNQPGTRLSNNWFTGTVGAMPAVDITNWVLSAGYVPGRYVQLRTGTSATESTITSLGARWWTASADATLLITTASINYGVFTADSDIGSPGMAGSGAYNASTGTYTVTGGGQDIWDYADHFNYLYKTQSGDAVIVAKVSSMQAADGWAKSGLMFRDSTAANAMYAGVYVTRESGVVFQWRSTTGGQATGVQVTGIGAPQWLKLVRSGNSFSAYYGSDGVNWTQVGTAQTIALSTTALVGLAVTAHNDTLLNTTAFTNLLIST